MTQLQPVHDADAEHEERVLAAHRAFMNANNRGDGAQAQTLWETFVGLVAQRSPKQVAKMERERGLR